VKPFKNNSLVSYIHLFTLILLTYTSTSKQAMLFRNLQLTFTLILAVAWLVIVYTCIFKNPVYNVVIINMVLHLWPVWRVRSWCLPAPPCWRTRLPDIPCGWRRYRRHNPPTWDCRQMVTNIRSSVSSVGMAQYCIYEVQGFEFRILRDDWYWYKTRRYVYVYIFVDVWLIQKAVCRSRIRLVMMNPNILLWWTHCGDISSFLKGFYKLPITTSFH